MLKYHQNSRTIFLFIFIFNAIDVNSSSAKHKEIENVFIYALDKKIFLQIDYNRMNFFCDHLGNNRMDVTDIGGVWQAMDYYPYGMPMGSSYLPCFLLIKKLDHV